MLLINPIGQKSTNIVKIEIVYVVRDEVRWIASYHTAKWQTQDIKSGSLATEPTLLSTKIIMSSYLVIPVNFSCVTNDLVVDRLQVFVTLYNLLP